MGLCNWTCGELAISVYDQMFPLTSLVVINHTFTHFIITLQGKPSAGKSTFFNAAVQQNHAKTAAHPFTTIEPNISKGYLTIPCPCNSMDFTCDAGTVSVFDV